MLGRFWQFFSNIDLLRTYGSLSIIHKRWIKERIVWILKCHQVLCLHLVILNCYFARLHQLLNFLSLFNVNLKLKNLFKIVIVQAVYVFLASRLTQSFHVFGFLLLCIGFDNFAFQLNLANLFCQFCFIQYWLCFFKFKKISILSLLLLVNFFLKLNSTTSLHLKGLSEQTKIVILIVTRFISFISKVEVSTKWQIFMVEFAWHRWSWSFARSKLSWVLVRILISYLFFKTSG